MNVIPEFATQDGSIDRLGDDARWTVQSLFLIVRRRLWTLLLCILGCLTLAVAYLVVTPPVYTATAVLVTDTKQSPPSPSQVSSELLIDPSVIESQIEILRSERIAADVVDRLHLDADPDFVGAGPGLARRIADRLLHRSSVAVTDRTRRMVATNALVAKTKVTRTGHSYLAEIAVTTLGPEKSATLANAIADAYIRDQLDGRMLANQRTAGWMKARVDEVRGQADAAGVRVEVFRRQNAAVLGLEPQPGAPAPAGGESSAVSEKPETTFGPDEASRQLQSLTDVARATRADSEALQNRYSRLTQFMQQQSLPVTEARILTSAEPPLTKSAPRSTVSLLLAGLGGLVLGGGLAFAREALDRRLRWPSQIQELGLPYAGALGFVRQANTVVRAGREMKVSRLEAKLLGRAALAWVTLFDGRRPWCAATQTLRTLKLAVDRSSRRSTGLVVGIVSPWPGEGKSTLAYNFGQLLSETGSEVLVIDADFGSPALSKSLAPDAVYGLPDVVAGNRPIEQCVSKTPLGFDLLNCSAGEIPIHPFHLLAGPSMQRALATAQSRYHYIVVDLPALLTSIDSQAIASFVDSFVLVTEYGRTRIDDVEQALLTSDTLTNRIAATVINKSRAPDKRGRRLRRAVPVKA